MNNTVIILGNGFDLDLGLKTSYKDFIDEIYLNTKSHKREQTNPLINDMLVEYKKEAGWIDIEDFLRRYALKLSKEGIPPERDIRDEYEKLSRDLHAYMYSDKEKNTGKEYNENSCAYHLLHFALEKSIPIFTLNYTDLTPIIKHVKGNNKDIKDSSNIGITYIHGNTPCKYKGKLPPAIIGIDPIEVNGQFVNMVKSARESYSPGIISALDNTQNIIFFGVGFGITDAPYFKPFFNKVLNEETGNIRVFVFTKGDGTDFYYRVSQMIGGENLPTFREKDIHIYDTSDDNSFSTFISQINL